MEWTKFIQYIAIAYLSYYGLIIILDLLKPSKNKAIKGEDDFLSFSEEEEALEVWEDLEQVPQSPTSIEEKWDNSEQDTEEIDIINVNENVSTGGVSSLEEIISLADSGTIEIRKSLIFQ